MENDNTNPESKEPLNIPIDEGSEESEPMQEQPEHSEIADMLLGSDDEMGDDSTEKTYPVEENGSTEESAEDLKPIAEDEIVKEEIVEEGDQTTDDAKLTEETINSAEEKAIEYEPEPIEETVSEEPVTTQNNPFSNNPVSSSEPITTESVATSLSTEPVKKKHGGVIALVIIIIILVLGLGGAAAAYFLTHTPENLALTSLADLMNIEGASVSGFIEATQETSTGQSRIDLTGRIDPSGQSELSAKVSMTSGDTKMELSTDTIVMNDYNIYTKLDGVKNLLNSAYSSTMNSNNSLTELGKKIDGNWWRINVPEIIDSIDEIDAKTKAEYKEKYSCVTSALDELKKNKTDYAELYKKNPFVKYTKYTSAKNFTTTGDPYLVSLDSEKLTNFMSSAATASDYSSLTKCLDLQDNESIVDYPTAMPSLSELPETIVTVKNNLLGGEITGIYINSEAYSASFAVSKNSQTIVAPTDSKSIVELVEMIMTAYQNYMAQQQYYYSYDYDSSYSLNDYNYNL